VFHWNKVTLAGVGLLGGSLGLALKQRRLARQVDGLVRRRVSLGECDRLGVVDQATRDPLRAAEGADLIVLCTPIGRMRETLDRMLPALKRGAIVTDVGSVKSPVVKDLEPLVARAGGCFVGSHPMAGAEKTGPAAARSDLFVNAVCVVTPTRQSPPRAVKQVEAFWKSVGCRTVRLTPNLHDDLVSRTSHLPHVVAAGLVNHVLNPARPKAQAMLCASGFRDTTRIASSSPAMWRDIALANGQNLARVLGVFIEHLQALRRALEKGDMKTIETFFDKAKAKRDAWCAQKASPSPE